MPLFAFTCQDCGARFEALVRSSDTPVCPSCGGAQLQQELSRISSDIKYRALAKSGRAAAAREGHLSNFSRNER